MNVGITRPSLGAAGRIPVGRWPGSGTSRTARRHRGCAVPCLLASVILSGCASDPSGGVEERTRLEGDACTQDIQCVSGLLCGDGVCRRPCNRVTDCDRLIQHCENGLCLSGGDVGCGDRSIDSGEACDDGNRDAGDGCSSRCLLENGWTCTGVPSVCDLLCGNGAIDVGEECDDANLIANDGCSIACAVESGWSCGGTPSVCYTTCGDGAAVGAETCDDGNSGLDDSCPSGPSGTCLDAVCGDGFQWVVGGSEACDDGGADPGDGCDANCAVETGWECAGVPSVCACAFGFQDNDSDGTCEPDCSSVPCTNGTCDDSSGTTVCTCLDFVGGPACDVCTVYVDAMAAGNSSGGTWGDAVPSVQAGLDLAAARIGGPTLICEVWVATGTYDIYVNGPLDTVQLRPNVHLYGGLTPGALDRSARQPASATILEGANPLGTDATQSVVNSDDDVLIDGFWIRGGRNLVSGSGANGGGLDCLNDNNVTVSNCWFSDNSSAADGGALLSDTCSITVSGCLFFQNSAGDDGGGLAINRGQALVESSAFIGNVAGVEPACFGVGCLGGALFAVNTNVTVRGCDFTDNRIASTTDQTLGGAIGTQAGTSMTVEDCTFTGNSVDSSGGNSDGGAIFGFGPGSLTVARSVIAGNTAGRAAGGIGFANNIQGILINVLIAGNSASTGAGIAVSGATANILGATVIYNSATGVPLPAGGGVMVELGGSLDMGNSILWGNRPDVAVAGSSFQVGYSLVEGGDCQPHCLWLGDNISLDPLFAAAPAPATSDWSTVQYEPVANQTRLTAIGAAWPPGALVGLLVKPSVTRDEMYVIRDNDGSSLVLDGDRSGQVLVGDSFTVIDPRLSASSPAIDAGGHDNQMLDDLEGTTRTRTVGANPPGGAGPSYPDMGAYEYTQ